MMPRALLLLLCLPALAQEVSQTYRSGEATLTIRVTPKKPVVGDEVRLELKATAPKGVRIEMPDTPGIIDCAEVVDRESPSASDQSFLLDPTGPGTCHIPALSVRFGASVIASREIVFQIASLIPPGVTDPDIHDGQTPLPIPRESVNWWFIALATVVVLAVVAWFTFSGRQPKERPTVREPAEVRARRRLSKLAQAPPVPREFYVELSRILTAYLDERLALGSSRCTSPEMLEAVQRTGLITSMGRDLLEALLADCDYAKFSPNCPVGDNPQEAVACCRKIIDILAAQAASRPRLRQVEGELTRA